MCLERKHFITAINVKPILLAVNAIKINIVFQLELDTVVCLMFGALSLHSLLHSLVEERETGREKGEEDGKC